MNLKTIIIQQELSGASSFVKRLNVPFMPKLMKVKGVSYQADGKDAQLEAKVSLIRMRALGEKIGYFRDKQSSHPELSFPVNQSFQGDHVFELLDNVEALETGRNGVLVICLEFSG